MEQFLNRSIKNYRQNFNFFFNFHLFRKSRLGQSREAQDELINKNSAIARVALPEIHHICIRLKSNFEKYSTMTDGHFLTIPASWANSFLTCQAQHPEHIFLDATPLIISSRVKKQLIPSLPSGKTFYIHTKDTVS